MPSVARLSDIAVGVCYGHKDPVNFTATFVAGSADTNANGLSVIRLGDSAPCSCGHVATVISGSGTVMTNGIPTARLGDPVVSSGGGNGTIVSGSGNVNAN